MAWIYLADTEGLVLPSKIISDQSFTVKESDTLRLSYFQECQKVKYLSHQSGTMSKRCQAGNCSHSTLTSYTEDSLVKTSVLQELEKAWKESEAAYFSRSCGWPKKSSPSSYSLKTSLQLEKEDSEKLEKNWPATGMIVDGVLYPLEKLELHTYEKDGFSWPSPRACMTGHITPERAKDKFNNLESVLARQIWPTPCARDYKDNGSPAEFNRNSLALTAAAIKTLSFPTPTCRDSAEKPMPPRKKTTKESGKTMGGQKPPLLTVVGGALNPTWVEWLMGVPLGWTELNSLGTEWFLSKSKRRSRG